MARTDTFIKNVKPTGAVASDKHADGLGLYLHVKEAGKYLRMNYGFTGKQKTLAPGVLVRTLKWLGTARADAESGKSNLLSMSSALAPSGSAINIGTCRSTVARENDTKTWLLSYEALPVCGHASCRRYQDPIKAVMTTK